MGKKRTQIKPSRLIGLTGNIASGKSTVAKYLQDKGHPVVSADTLARHVTAPGKPAHQQIVQHFGTGVLHPHQEINRRVLRDVVFHEPKKRKLLESIIHPAIQEESQKAFDQLMLQGPPLIFYEAPLLIEANRHKECDGVVLITSDDALRLQRLLARDAIPMDLAQKMISSQMSQKEKENLAHWIIKNNQSLEDLKKAVEKLLQKILNTKS